MPRGADFRQQVAQTPGSLVASARSYSNDNAGKLVRKVNQRQTSRAWQEDLWTMYDIVPEFRLACDWVGNSISSAILGVSKAKKPTTDSIALDVLASLHGGPEGQSEMWRMLGVNFTVAGEAWLVGRTGDDGQDVWKVHPAVDIQGDSFGTVITVDGEPLKDGELAIRMWKAHARRPEESHSPSRAVLPTLNQIVKLSMVIDAQADSRLTSAGILWVPSEMEMPGAPVIDVTVDGQTESVEVVDGAQGLFNTMVRVAQVALDKRDSAAAQVPVVIAAPGEFLEKIQHTSFWSGFDEHVKSLREEAIGRIGTGMDMPPEVLTGTGDVNHWGSWQIEEAAIKSYTEPLLNIIVDSMTTGYLHPFLKSQGVADWEAYRFTVDTSSMRLRPNRSKEAVELWDRGMLSTRTALIENGFDPENDIMSKDERQVWMLMKIASGSATPNQVAAAAQQLGVAIPAELEPQQETREARPMRSLDQHPTRTAPDPEDSESQEALAASAAVIPMDGLVYALDQMVFRALERAGNRLKGKVGRALPVPSYQLYMSVSSISSAEAAELLTDAWTCLDRFDYPGVDVVKVEEILETYTTMLLRRQEPLNRTKLAAFVQQALAAESAAA